MTQPSEPHRRRNNNHISSFLQSTASNFLSLYSTLLHLHLHLSLPPQSPSSLLRATSLRRNIRLHRRVNSVCATSLELKGKASFVPICSKREAGQGS
ncbi:hypothetical protein P8452_50971 [Trifolium repens]|nr:hypothetical protein P8452_50971 [Trifolium repens]